MPPASHFERAFPQPPLMLQGQLLASKQRARNKPSFRKAAATEGKTFSLCGRSLGRPIRLWLGLRLRSASFARPCGWWEERGSGTRVATSSPVLWSAFLTPVYFSFSYCLLFLLAHIYFFTFHFLTSGVKYATFYPSLPLLYNTWPLHLLFCYPFLFSFAFSPRLSQFNERQRPAETRGHIRRVKKRPIPRQARSFWGLTRRPKHHIGLFVAASIVLSLAGVWDKALSPRELVSAG